MRTARLLLVTLVALAAAAAAFGPAAPRPRFNDGGLLYGSFTGVSSSEMGNTGVASGSSSVLLRVNGTTWNDLVLRAGATVYALAINPDSGNLFIGGSFTSLAGVADTARIAEYDGVQVKALGRGLDDDVRALAHTGTALYVGGTFTNALGAVYTYYQTLVSIAKWADGRWQPMPGGGLNGGVYTMTLSIPAGKLFVGGDFSGTATGAVDKIDQLASKGANVVVATAAYSSDFAATNILNNPNRLEGPGNVYLTTPYASNPSLTIGLGYSATVQRIRVANTRYLGNGTAELQIATTTSDPAIDNFDSAVTFSYVSPRTGRWGTCSTSCALSRDPSLPYVDLYFSAATTITGIKITFPSSSLGTAGGLSSVQIMSSNKMFNRFNVPTGDTMTFGGTWTQGGTPYIGLGAFYRASVAANVRITFTMKFSAAGAYSFIVQMGPCDTSPCSTQTNIEVLIDGTSVDSRDVSSPASSTFDALDNVARLIQANSEVTIVLKPLGDNGDEYTFVSASTAPKTVVQAGELQRFAAYNLATSAAPVSLVDTTLSGTVYTMEHMMGDGEMLVLGGDFTATIDNSSSSYLLKVDTATLGASVFAEGGLNEVVYALQRLQDDSGLVIGGSSISSTQQSTQVTNPCIFNYTSNSYMSLARGVQSGTVRHVVTTEESIWIMGDFIYALQPDDDIGLTAPRIVRYDLAAGRFFGVSSIVGGTIFTALANTTKDADLSMFVGGFDISRATSKSAYSVATNVGSDYVGIGEGFEPRLSSGYSNAANIAASVYFNNTFYVGGYLYAQGTYENHLAGLAMLDQETKQWLSVGRGVQGEVRALLVHNGELWVGGIFEVTWDEETRADRVALRGLAIWNGNEYYFPGAQLTYSGSTYAEVYAMVEYGSLVFVGGYFLFAGEAVTRNIAVWDGSQWSGLGVGLDGDVLALAIADNYLVVGGSFNYAGGLESNYLALYDLNTGRWRSIGSDLDDSVASIAVDRGINSVFISGDFSGIFAKFDGEDLVFFDDNNPSNYVSSIAIVDADNTPANDLISSGRVLVAYGVVSANGQAGRFGSMIFDGVNWRPGVAVSQAFSGNNQYVNGYTPRLSAGGLLPWQIAITVVLVVLGTAAIVGGLVYFFYYRNRAGK